ncbi:hypothetical protein J1N35_009070 [Gossypium stocksii]|uniref:Uncharacterized protein n=1 Tax=Gossypium stocksii TaxID=47602 RepID=A0A9D4AF27_9ROSI|nr:hypothetical protein J1N35_009070 [Gossypium stocksii]
MADFNGETSNKDKRYRKRAKDCHELQADLICMILDGDDKYRTTRRWEDKQVIVVEAMNRLRDPHLLQQWLRKLQSGIVENPSFSLSSNNAFQELHSVLSQPTNPVQDINFKALQKEMEVQGEAIEDQTEQLISEAKDFRMVAKVLNKVWASYVAKQQLSDPVSIQDLVQTDDESFIFHFPLTPDCSRCAKIRINLQGYHEVDPDLSSLWFFDVEKHDLENRHLPDFGHQYPGEGSSDARANQENMKLSNENISPVQGDADFQNIPTNSLTEADHKIESKPERLELKDITNIEDLLSPRFFDVEKYDLENRLLPDFGHQYPGEGSSDARANQENMKLSYENTSPVQGHADFHNILANSLTEADHNIESKPERLELKDITNIEGLLLLQDFFDRGTFDDVGNWDLSDFGHQYPDEGSSDARANQENMKLSHENTSPVRGHADFHNILANSLTEADHNIESKPERFELKDITNIEDLSSLWFFDVEKYDLENRHLPDFGHQYPGEGSSDARANQENMKLSHENTSPVQGHADFQNILANSLTEADHNIESKPEKLELKDITNIEGLLLPPDFFDSGTFDDLVNWDLSDFGHQYPGEGSSDARANQENMKLSHENTSPVQGHADFQNILSNSLAEADHKESNPERLGLRDITNMEVTVQKKRNNLEEETKKNKANITKGKRQVEKSEADLKENILKVVKDVAGLKENRMKLRKDDAKLQENQLKLTSLPKKPRGA